MTPIYQNIIRLRYLGNNRYSASWMGWPSEGSKRVNKRLSGNTYVMSTDGAALEAANLFVAWLDQGPHGPVGTEFYTTKIATLTIGQDSPDCHMVGVTTQRCYV